MRGYKFYFLTSELALLVKDTYSTKIYNLSWPCIVLFILYILMKFPHKVQQALPKGKYHKPNISIEQVSEC